MVTETFAFDPYSPSFQANPYPWYEVLRSDHPLYRDPENRFWVLCRYEDVRTAMLDHETFLSGEGIVLGQDTHSFPPMLSAVDPPQHTQMRRAAQPHFSPKRVDAMTSHVEEVVRRVVDTLVGRDNSDLFFEFAAAIPIQVIAELCGIPQNDLQTFQGWLAEVIIAGMDSDQGAAAFQKMADYFAAAVDDREGSAGDDLTTHMANATYEGRLLPHIERVGLAMVMFVGGIEATTMHLANMAALLATRPEIQMRLRQDLTLIPGALEESLRYDSPVQADLRELGRDVVLYGQTLRKGEKVMLLTGAANRDPEVFQDPDRFDLTRHPNPHLAFVLGIHNCIGAGLARLEARLAFEELLRRVPPFRLVGNEVQRSFTNTAVMRGVETLPVTFEV